LTLVGSVVTRQKMFRWMGHPTYIGKTRNYLKMLVNSPNRKISGERQKQLGYYMKFVREICFEDDKLILVDQELVQ